MISHRAFPIHFLHPHLSHPFLLHVVRLVGSSVLQSVDDISKNGSAKQRRFLRMAKSSNQSAMGGEDGRANERARMGGDDREDVMQGWEVRMGGEDGGEHGEAGAQEHQLIME